MQPEPCLTDLKCFCTINLPSPLSTPHCVSNMAHLYGGRNLMKSEISFTLLRPGHTPFLLPSIFIRDAASILLFFALEIFLLKCRHFLWQFYQKFNVIPSLVFYAFNVTSNASFLLFIRSCYSSLLLSASIDLEIYHPKLCSITYVNALY